MTAFSDTELLFRHCNIVSGLAIVKDSPLLTGTFKLIKEELGKRLEPVFDQGELCVIGRSLGDMKAKRIARGFGDNDLNLTLARVTKKINNFYREGAFRVLEANRVSNTRDIVSSS